MKPKDTRPEELSKPKDDGVFDLLEKRKAVIANGGKKVKEKPVEKKLTAKEYLHKIYFVQGSGDEEVHIRLLWKSKDDGKGRARVNFYSPSKSCLTKSVFVIIWHDKDRWYHEEFVAPKKEKLAIKELCGDWFNSSDN